MHEKRMVYYSSVYGTCIEKSIRNFDFRITLLIITSFVMLDYFDQGQNTNKSTTKITIFRVKFEDP